MAKNVFGDEEEFPGVGPKVGGNTGFDPNGGLPDEGTGLPAPAMAPTGGANPHADMTRTLGEQAGQFANTQQGFLDWATQKYGADPNRGGGFVDANAGGGLESMLKAYTDATGNTGTYMGGPSGDRVDFGNGAQDALTSGGQVWNPSAGGGSGAAGGYTGGQPTTSAPAGGLGDAGNPQSAVDVARRQKILEMLAKPQGPIDIENDPNLASQSNAYNVARTRGANNQRAKLAERSAMSGLNTGGQGSGSFDTNLGGIYDDAGQDMASHDASLVGGELQARRQEMLQALQMANAVGAQDEAQQIQLQLAALDDQFRKQQLSQQGSQFNQQLDQNQSQWDDTYGLQSQQFLQSVNRDSVLQALLSGT